MIFDLFYNPKNQYIQTTAQIIIETTARVETTGVQQKSAVIILIRFSRIAAEGCGYRPLVKNVLLNV